MFWPLEFLGYVAVKCSILNVICALCFSGLQLRATRLKGNFQLIASVPSYQGQTYHSLWCLILNLLLPAPLDLAEQFPWGSPTCECSLISGFQENSSFNNAFFFTIVPNCCPLNPKTWDWDHLCCSPVHWRMNGSYQNLRAAWLYVNLTQASYLKRGLLSWDSTSIRSR